MKNLIKKIIFRIIQSESRIILRKYKPKIIAVTGSVGKTSTKDAIYTALSSVLYINKNQKSYNSEIGIPLTIIGRESGWGNLWAWTKNILEGLALILLKNVYPEWLVIEAGIDHPGDMDFINSLIKSDIVVFTKFSKSPVHVGFFESPEELIKEKKKLLKSLKDEGILVLNSDDDDILKIRDGSGKHSITYGFNNEAEVRASNLEIFYRNNKPVGIDFKVNMNGNSLPIILEGVLGIQHVYPVLVSLAIGKALNLNILKLVHSFKNHAPAPGRMRILDGIYNSTIIDDSYNSSPVAVEEALNVLKLIKANKGSASAMPQRDGARKIAVLGDMLELGKYTEDEHIKVGKKVIGILDVLITVGKGSKDIAKSARESGFNENNIHEFDNVIEARKFIENFLREDDTILIKGSQSIRLEKVVESVMARPEEAKWLLVRQERDWLRKII
jgi:UDP-N-acetylmuramoyl-tripeptide--D-alanyl-D-alanine ligase